MPYSRRTILRNAALLSMARVTGSSPLSLFAMPAKAPTAAPIPPFAPGIRIFFAGSWLFCGDPTPGMMRAVSVEMGPMMHRFPYGVWTAAGIDSGAKALDENVPETASKKLVPYRIAVSVSAAGTQQPFSPGFASVNALFAAALCQAPFFYLENSNSKLSIDFTNAHLRVISMPIPTRIIPAAFLSDASLTDASMNYPLAKAAHGCSSVEIGVPTTHILEYQGASALALSDPKGNPLDTVGQNNNYHFHTVPSIKAPSQHGEMMLGVLLSLINDPANLFDASDFSLNNANGCSIVKGPNVPDDVTPEELEMIPIGPATGPCLLPFKEKVVPKPRSGMQHKTMPQNNITYNAALASCASGGFGLGGDCC